MRGVGSKPRLKDVAALAGVSLGSASRALSHPEAVRESTRAAVRAAAERLDYAPDLAARALASRRTATIGLLAPTLANPIYAAFAQASQTAAAARGLQLLIASHEYERAQGLAHVRSFVQRGVDGLILIGADHHPDVAEILSATPHIYAWSYDEARGKGCIGVSNRSAMQTVVRHLLDLGHRRFAVLTGDYQHNERARSRLEGIRDALLANGTALKEEAVIVCPFSIHAGQEAMSRVLTLCPQPTAIICGSDLLAAGAMAEAAQRGVRVPGDISVTGFDDVDFAALLTPPLTTIRVPASDMGRHATNSLIDAIGGRESSDLQLPADLILRASTGPAPRHSSANHE